MRLQHPHGALTGTRIGPGSPLIAHVEQARRPPGQRSVEVALDAMVGPVDIGGPVVTTWTYGGQLPGREIRLRRGELLSAHLVNHLPQSTTVHWHGIALRNDVDGVPDLTQPAIAAGASMRYEFTVPDAGTYWFHPHVGPQLDRGLYAPLIIEDPGDGADYDQELVVVFGDWLDGTGRTPDQVLADLQTHGMGGGMGGMVMPQSALLGGDAGDVTYPYYLANGRNPDRTGHAAGTHPPPRPVSDQPRRAGSSTGHLRAVEHETVTAEPACPRSPVHLSNTRDVYDTTSRAVGHRFTPPEEATVHDTIWNPTERRRLHLDPSTGHHHRSAGIDRQTTGVALPAPSLRCCSATLVSTRWWPKPTAKSWAALPR